MCIKRFLILPFSCFSFVGCASIVHGTRQEVSISSNPSEAMVSDGEVTIKTPGKINLKRNKDHILTITKPGYETESVRIVRVISGALAGNILAGGVIGWGVDAVSGAQWRLEPETVAITLRPVKDGEKVDGLLRSSLATLEKDLSDLQRLKESGSITEEEYQKLREIAIQAAKGEPALAQEPS